MTPAAPATCSGRKCRTSQQSSPIPFSVFTGKNAWLEVRFQDQLLSPRRQIVSAPFALKAEGEVPEGGIILGAQSGDANILGLGYLQESDTVGNYYLYKKQAYNPASPRAPQRIAYQGRVMRADGSSVGISANLVFSLYDAESAGSLKWTETQNNVPIAKGIFSVELGAVSPIYPSTLSQANLWLEVRVNGEILSPREKLTSAAYALKVESPVPFGGIVLSPTSANSKLSSKKFTSLGAALKGYYLFQKSAFSSADPAVPLLVNYQGRLSNAAGVAIAGNRDFHFSIFDHLTGPALLWSETIGGVSIPGGIYNVLLGGVHSITPDTFPGPDAFLEIQVIQGAIVETLSPRTRLTSVPFALSAEGTLPPTSLILGDIVDDPTLLNSGFTMTGDTIRSFHVYSKTDADISPPSITIVSPQDGMTTNATISIHITYTDAQSGVDTSSLHVYHNDTEVTTLTVDDTSATGSVLGVSEGGNLIRASIADRAGNVREVSALVLIESGLPPLVTIFSPANGQTVLTNTPYFRIEYYDQGSTGVDPATVRIMLDGVDSTANFDITPSFADWQVKAENVFSNGSHTIQAWAEDYFGNLSDIATGSFSVSFIGNNPTITTLSPDFTVGGDTITITGMNFGSTIEVYFTGTLGGVTATINGTPTSTQIKATVPGSVISGKVWVANIHWLTGGDQVMIEGNSVDFTYGLPYAFITNRGSHRVTIFDYRDNSFPSPGSILMPGASPTPYQADVTPDGRYILVANWNTSTITVIDGLSAFSIKNTVAISCKTTKPKPQALAISPDGSRVFVGTDSLTISVFDIRKLVGATPPTCADGESASYTEGSVFRDLEFSPDGKRVLVATDNTAAVNGKVLSVDSGRYYLTDLNSNGDYLDYDLHEMTQTNSKRNPAAVGFLPQRMASSPANPWRGYVVNQANNGASDYDEESVLLREPEHASQGFVVTNLAGQHPPCFGGVDVAISPLGDRAWFGFNYSNNVGLLEVADGTATILAATQATVGCTYSSKAGCVAPWIREVAYTPYRNKLIAAIWGATAADSYLKVLSADTTSIPVGTTGTISASLYVTADHSSLQGPEGIGVWPHFDRDGDKISDLIEAVNYEGILRANGTTDYLNPVSSDTVDSRPNGNTLVGGLRLPDEGMGYRHFYNVQADINADNWGTLRLLQVIEAVGREWNYYHPGGPRISVADISMRRGGTFTPHKSHKNGRDADILYVRSDGKEAKFDFDIDQVSDYSKPLTQELVNLFCEMGVNLIYADKAGRSQLTAPAGCTIDLTEDDHQHHFHIRIP
jgi:hypothetical protein